MSFRSCQSYWRFESAVANCTRYIFEKETSEFLKEILSSCKSRQRTIKSGTIFWRSQLGGDVRPVCDDEGNEIADEPCPFPEERMRPLKFLANEGRANPKGIPYLYVATSKETAMSEVRPWIGSEISVAQFRVVKELTIIDCSENYTANPLFFDNERGLYEPSVEEKERAVWAHIDKAFSEPVTQDDNHAYYAPTQIIAELFKKNGFDGVAYKSMLSDGYNIAFFDPLVVEMLNCFLYEALKVSFSFEEIANPYFIKS